jgi:hypothetical protein
MGDSGVIESAARVVVVIAGIYLVFLGVACLAAPAGARRFLLGFAGSAWKHYAELCTRLLLGAAFLLAAPRMAAPGAFTLFGWLLLGTTVGLLLLPWRWHHRFARWAVPEALRFLPLVGAASLVFGALVLWAAVGTFAAQPNTEAASTVRRSLGVGPP